ncbi:MAG: deoxyhypusine synthase [Candidatus Micrarchaeota archaeon]
MIEVKGFEIKSGLTAGELVASFSSLGFQASELAKAVSVIRSMRKDKATIFLSFTSNMVSSGLRELFAQMCRDKLVDVVVTSIGSVEEDLMKTKAPFFLGDFNADDAELHKKEINRIGNVFVPTARYVELEKMLKPFFLKELNKQKEKGRLLSPSEVIRDLGETIEDENSFLYWCFKNNIPVFCPAPTDGAFGLQLFFFKQDHAEFGIDVTGDMKSLSDLVLNAEKTGGIILGGGFAKHHVIGMNLVRGGLDYAVYVCTASEYDGSLSGARTKEAVSWGKINEKAKTAFVDCDATIALPLILAGLKD